MRCDPNVVAAVFARGGSKGVPGKNVRPLGGLPLIVYAIQAARAARHVRRVVVSTDSEQIAQTARRAGAEVPFLRPEALSRDDSPEWLAWQHLLRSLEQTGESGIDVLLSVPATSPLRSVGDLDACIELLWESDADAVITVTPAARNPYFNMVTLDADHCARLVMSSTAPPVRRQDAPPVYDMATVAYALRPAFVMRASRLFDGKVRAVVVPPERAVDIDTELDFRIAECLLAARAPRFTPS